MRQLKITQQITDRSGKSIEAYLKEVARESTITPEEEVALAKRIRNNDEVALEKLVVANLRFVISVAKQYQNFGLELEDLINEGNLGLIEAARRFDETRGFKFISYAVWWIRQSILKAIAEKTRKIRIPANRSKLAREIAQASLKIEQKYERRATDEELSELLEISPEDIRELINITQKQGSIDAPLTQEDERFSLGDMLEDKNISEPGDDLMKESLNQEIEFALADLDVKEAEVIRLSFGLNRVHPMSLEDIGDQLGLGQERVRQIRNKGLRKLKKSANLKLLKSYL